MRTINPAAHASARARMFDQRRAFWRQVRAWAVAFCAMAAQDFAWAVYVASVKAGSALAASGWAVALFLLGAIAVLGYTRDRFLLIPASLGAALGTWAGVVWQV